MLAILHFIYLAAIKTLRSNEKAGRMRGSTFRTHVPYRPSAFFSIDIM